MDRLNNPKCYFNELPEMLQRKRDKIVDILRKANMIPVIPEGGYFILADYSKLGRFVVTMMINSFIVFVLNVHVCLGEFSKCVFCY